MITTIILVILSFIGGIVLDQRMGAKIAAVEAKLLAEFKALKEKV